MGVVMLQFERSGFLTTDVHVTIEDVPMYTVIRLVPNCIFSNYTHLPVQFRLWEQSAGFRSLIVAPQPVLRGCSAQFLCEWS